MCQPGEYALSSSATLLTPFCLCNVELYIGQTRLEHSTGSELGLNMASYVILVFSIQKNTVPGENIGHGRSGHPYFGIVKALVCRVLHLRGNRAANESPLHCYYPHPHARQNLHVHIVTTHLHQAVAHYGTLFGITAPSIEAHSLRASGAMGYCPSMCLSGHRPHPNDGVCGTVMPCSATYM